MSERIAESSSVFKTRIHGESLTIYINAPTKSDFPLDVSASLHFEEVNSVPPQDIPTIGEIIEEPVNSALQDRRTLK